MSSAGGPEITVVVPVRNVAPWLPRQLGALAAQRCDVPWEVVVADNGSDDDTVAVARSFADRMDLRVGDASGAATANRGRNIGAEAARGDLLLFCDGDDEVEPGWIAAYHRRSDEWDLAGGRLDDTTLNDERVLARTSNLKFGSGLPSLGPWLRTVNGCNFAVHRNVHEKVQGFDESWGRGGDDLDYGFRVQLAGFRLGYVDDAVIGYRLRTTTRALARWRYDLARSRGHLYRRFGPYGMPRRSWRHAAYRYLQLLGDVGELRTPEGRTRWAGDAAWHLGMIAGSLSARARYLSE
jgi:glycosyltransferase involved in cell wall biosynthesis